MGRAVKEYGRVKIRITCTYISVNYRSYCLYKMKSESDKFFFSSEITSFLFWSVCLRSEERVTKLHGKCNKSRDKYISNTTHMIY